MDGQTAITVQWMIHSKNDELINASAGCSNIDKTCNTFGYGQQP